jgi:hypothetical protein
MTLDQKSAEDVNAWTIEAWDLKRSKSYGSKHLNQRQWPVKKAILSNHGKTITLTIPDLAPTWSMSIIANTQGKNGEALKRVIHNTIHQLNDTLKKRN